MLLLALTGCSAAHLQVDVTPCITVPPPAAPRLRFVRGLDAGTDCPPRFARCLPAEDDPRLDAWLTEVDLWQVRAWRGCGPLPDSGLPPTPNR
jgi:hypothetical protein